MANPSNTVASAVSSAADTVASKIATGAQYGGGGVAFLGGLSANEIAAYGGLLIGFIGLLVNIYYKRQHLQLARQRAKADPEE